ncbi:enoyl-CoA hydratase/isomerase family protein [Microbacterium hominis]|uniref:enoyl-CoA hydratase/isomerase family protein n=1 Tax=Microbacterium hominis TaxID=162426 RepID=UPI003B834443
MIEYAFERIETDAGGTADLATITLRNAAVRNAVDEESLRALDAAYRRAEADGARAVLLQGEGRAFCAGRDISRVDPRTDDVPGYLDGLLAPLLRRIADFPAPTFAAAQGACLGVGLGLLIATDVVYVADDAKIGSPFGALGAALDSGGHAFFLERLGAHRTLDLVYTGHLLSGAEAVAGGLFSRSMPLDELTARTREAAIAAASGPTAAFVASKRLLWRLRTERLGFWDALDAESSVQATLSTTEDYREGFAAFQQRRAPVFRGR